MRLRAFRWTNAITFAALLTLSLIVACTYSSSHSVTEPNGRTETTTTTIDIDPQVVVEAPMGLLKMGQAAVLASGTCSSSATTRTATRSS